jgi:hypothetical protein
MLACRNLGSGLSFWQNLVEKVTATGLQRIANSKEQGEEGSKQKAGISKQQADQERRAGKGRSFFSSLD